MSAFVPSIEYTVSLSIALPGQPLRSLWGRAIFQYEPDEVYPSAVVIKLSEPDAFVVGTNYLLAVSVPYNNPNPMMLSRTGTLFMVTVASISDDGLTLNCFIQQPTNVPGYWNRATTLLLDDVPDAKPIYIPWKTIVLMKDLQLDGDISLGDDSSLVQLTDTDQFELFQFAASLLELEHFGVPNPRLRAAFCTNLNMEDAKTQRHLLLDALRLFKPGDVEIWAAFEFDTNPKQRIARYESVWRQTYGSSILPPYLDTAQPPTYRLLAGDVQQFIEWWGQFTVIPISDDSALGRALHRFRRSYNASPIESLTDAVIGLETLNMSDQSNEITHRVGQRTGHLLSENPALRLEIQEHVRDAYSERSGSVHKSAPGSDDTRNLLLFSQDYLRKSIRTILGLDPDIRTFFTGTPSSKSQSEKFGKQQNRFFECLIAGGSITTAQTLWHNSEILRVKS